MDLLWPLALLFLAVLPIVVLGYVLALRRRRRSGVRYSSLSLVRDAQPERPGCAAICRSRPSWSPWPPSSWRSPGRSRSWTCRRAGPRSSWRWTSRAAWARRTSPRALLAAEQAAGRSCSGRARGPRSGSSRSAGSPRWSRPRPTIRRSCCGDPQPHHRAPDGGRQRAPDGPRHDRRSRSERGPRASTVIRASRYPVPKGAYAPDIVVLTDGANNAGPGRWTPPSRRRIVASGSTRSASGRPTAGRSTRTALPSSSVASLGAG